MSAIRRCQRLDLVGGCEEQGGRKRLTENVEAESEGGWGLGWVGESGRKTNGLRADTLMELFLRNNPVSRCTIYAVPGLLLLCFICFLVAHVFLKV